MPVKTLPEMITDMRDHLDDEAPGDAYTDTQLLGYLNDALGYYDGQLAIHARSLFMQSKDISHDGSELQRVLPYLPRIVSIERTTNSPRTETVPMWNGFGDRFLHLGNVLVDSESGQFNHYYVQNNQLGFLPAPSSGNTDRVWVVLSSPPLHYGEVTSYTAGTKALVVQTLDPDNDTEHLGDMVLMDDAYNEMNIIFHDEREVNTITDWAQSTKTATLAFTQQTAPDANDNYSILPRLHPEYHNVLIYHACKLAMASHNEDIAEMQHFENEVRDGMYQYLSIAQQQRESYVKMVHGYYQ